VVRLAERSVDAGAADFEAVGLLHHVLDVEQAFTNYGYILYQQPLNAMTPQAVVKRQLVAPNLTTTLIQERQFGAGYVSGPLSTQGNTLWENAWAAVKST